MTERTEIIEREEGVTVNVKVKRGTGTRDQDSVSVTAHYASIQEAHADESRIVNLARKHAFGLREIQPESDGEDE
jgi:hypothetical protein